MVCSSNHIPVPTCGSSVCNGICAAGFADCNANRQADGCEVNTGSDTSNCGTCGHICAVVPHSTPGCSAGTCAPVCNTGYGNCNGNYVDGCEVDLSTSSSNCGTCGHICPTGMVCGAGSCYAP